MENRDKLAQLLSLEEVAELLGKHPRTIRRLVDSGAIPAYRIPGTRGLYFKADEVLAALEPVAPDEEEEDE
jgi:excisionase family DNA binding protein